MESGLILIWSGAIANIPSGFVLCDGNNGTPNLQNRFVVGAGDTYAVNDTGGNINHNHTFTGDGHTHRFPAGDYIFGGFDFDNDSNSTPAAGTTDNGNGLPPW